MSEGTHTQQQSPYAIPAAIVIAGALIAGALFFAQPRQAAPQIADGQNPQQAGPQITDQVVKGIQADDNVMGNRDAKVVIVEFSDAECPFCKMFHDTMNRIMSEYKDSGNVAWVYRHYPLPQLHQKATKEAVAIECASKLGGQDAFWKFTNNLYDITPSNDGLNHAELPNMAVKAGVDKGAFEKCLKNDETMPRVQRDIDEGQALGIGGTPQSYVVANGKQISIEGAQRYETVKQYIEQALAE